MKISIPQKAFKAVDLAMAIKDIRHYLCGVMLEHNGEETRLVATDGHRLHAVSVSHQNAPLCAPCRAGCYCESERLIMQTYFRESGSIGLPTIKVIGSTENALNYAKEHSLEWMPPDDRCIEKTIELGE